MKEYILAIDQGTTSSRAIIFDRSSSIVAIDRRELTQYCPANGWVEHDPEEIWTTVRDSIMGVLAKSGLRLSDMAAIGITNQRETTLVWDRASGKPVYNAICWQSRQSKDICREWIDKGYGDNIHRKTGLLVNPYFSAGKIRWILDNVAGARERAEKGELCFGTVDSYLVYRLTCGKLHITDVSNASRTMIFNINTMEWDRELLRDFGIPEAILPEVADTNGIYGIATALQEIEPGAEVPVASIVGDQQASLFGQCCYEKGDVKNTYGTGCFMLMNTREQPVFSGNGLLTTVAWRIGGKVEYALEGSVFIAGAALQWLGNPLHLLPEPCDLEGFISSSDGVYVVPAFVGLGAPYWDNDVRGVIFGLTRATTGNNIATATLESIAYQSRDVMEVMKEESGTEICSLAVDGGVSASDYLMQFQADILDVDVVRPLCLESTALGAAYLAGLAVGFWRSREDIAGQHAIDRVFSSNMEAGQRESLCNGWKTAVGAARAFKP